MMSSPARKEPAASKKAFDAKRAGQKPAAKKDSTPSPLWRYLPEAITFLVAWVFLSWVYGDVMWRVEQESYVSANAMQMKPVTDLSMGWLLYAGRWLLTLFKYPLLGGTLMALVLTACCSMLAYVLSLPSKWRWTAFLLPYPLFAYIVWLGFSVFHRNEPSWAVIVLPMICCMVLCVLTIVKGLFSKHRMLPTTSAGKVICGVACLVVVLCAVCSFAFLPLKAAIWLFLCAAAIVFALAFGLNVLLDKPEATETPYRGRLIAPIVLLVLGVAVNVTALKVNDSVIATSAMQRMMEDQDWEGMTETALKLDRPTRSVAAYYALALENQNALLEGLFDLPFDFPKVKFHSDFNGDEYTLFTADCNLTAGLVNSAYHVAFEQVVICGPNVHWFKTMAKAALLNGEMTLARKYIGILRANPFEGSFCDRIEPMIADTSLIAQDPELSHVRQLAMRDKHPFEQMFRTPLFLGYNMGLAEGPDEVLRTSVAACLYSKDLKSFIPRAQVYMAKGWAMPECMQQALVIYSVKHGGADFLQQFKGAISPMVEQTVASFSRDVAPYVKDKEAMRRELKKDWLGTYIYYYYCENNNPDQVRKQESAGVN